MASALVGKITQGLPFVALDPYLILKGEYEGADGKGELVSQEKAFIFNLMLIVLLVFGSGAFSLGAWLLSNSAKILECTAVIKRYLLLPI